ncbi:hypothetical protein [Pelosinus propionicus]|uniref:Uncharacterized protein n=1 Tax=Pelosinus propionicus DSM 13327 TaxID=1123291 RepID=A0A1I4N8D5_9FIRM|nr:hypothetical protein [Pelosinus propionicus]SFM11655.1 hypothetical protein SAMN04490355_104222 [Pelosinus propionicus DSM 13327]
MTIHDQIKEQRSSECFTLMDSINNLTASQADNIVLKIVSFINKQAEPDDLLSGE